MGLPPEDTKAPPAQGGEGNGAASVAGIVGAETDALTALNKALKAPSAQYGDHIDRTTARNKYADGRENQWV